MQTLLLILLPMLGTVWGFGFISTWCGCSTSIPGGYLTELARSLLAHPKLLRVGHFPRRVALVRLANLRIWRVISGKVIPAAPAAPRFSPWSGTAALV